MKRFFFFLFFLLIVSAGALYAFSIVKETNARQTRQWFIYTGSTSSGENDQTNYVAYTGTGAPEDCGGGEVRCAIYAEPVIVSGVVRPNLSTIDNSQTMFKEAQ